MKYELIVIWESGEKEVLPYNDYQEARQAAQYMKTAFGSQISWTGIREAQ